MKAPTTYNASQHAYVRGVLVESPQLSAMNDEDNLDDEQPVFLDDRGYPPSVLSHPLHMRHSQPEAYRSWT